MPIPFFGAFEKGVGQIKKAINDRKYILLAFYFSVVLLSGIVLLRSAFPALFVSSKLPKSTVLVSLEALEASDSNVALGNQGSVTQILNKFPPPTLDYRILEASKKENSGFYNTVFELTFHIVQGTPLPQAHISTSTFIGCSEAILSEHFLDPTEDLKPTFVLRTTCYSAQPIFIDSNRELFTL